MTRDVLLAVSSLVVTLPGPLAAQEMVGYVAALEGGDAEILRAERKRRLQLGENILAGDTITVGAPSKTRVRIDTRSGPVDPCVPPPPTGECRRRFMVGGGLVPSEIAGRLSAMVAWFTAPSRNFVTRSDDPPRIRLGAGTSQAVVAGKRPFWIAWTDGTPPFKVELEARGGVIAQLSTTEREAQLPPASIPEGVIALSVTDHAGRKATLALDARRAGPSRTGMGDRAVDADHRRILEAAELASIDRGRWTFEAVQGMPELASRSQVADAMRRALVAGDKL